MTRRLWLLVPASLMLLVLSGCSSSGLSVLDYNDPTNSFFSKYLIVPLASLMDWFAGLLFNQYGLAILVITVLIRLIILPLSLKQFRSSKKMQELQPEMKKLRDEHKANPQKMQEETMKLYQKHGVNPLAGCLPAIVQMPILIALYQAIMRNPNIVGHGEHFLWFQLDQPEKIWLPIIAAATTYLQQLFMQSQMNSQMRIIMFIFPVMIYVMALQFPAALALYWIYGNIFTSVQYYFMYGGFKGKTAVIEQSAQSGKGSKKKSNKKASK
ncbi:YidC/Oxa1 family membrane protein insertase [Paenibacillus albiflavus]|nr:YidC/Oxa1 family membrane protein insertase [Paenibacillus albiflavus]